MTLKKAIFLLCFFSQTVYSTEIVEQNNSTNLSKIFHIENILHKKNGQIAPINFIIEEIRDLKAVYRKIHFEYKPSPNFKERHFYGQHVTHVDNFTLSTTPMYSIEIDNHLQIGVTYFPEFLAHTLIDDKESFFFSINYNF